MAGLEGGEFLGVLSKSEGLDGADAFFQVGGGEIEQVEDGFHGAAQGAGVFDGGEIGGDEPERLAGGREERLASVDPGGGLRIFVVFVAGELDGDFCAVGRGVNEERVFLPGGEEALNRFVAGADERRDDRDALGGGLGQGGLGDDRARGVGGAGKEAEAERSEDEEAAGAMEKIHR